VACTDRRSAVVADGQFRRSMINGKSVCLLSDALVERNPERYSSWRFGSVEAKERVPSQEVSLKPNIHDLFRAVVVWSWSDLSEAFALRELLSGFAKPMCRLPLLGFCQLPQWFWFFYVFAGVRLFAGPAARFASGFDELLVVCFYNTRSLALVRAFRAVSKEVVDIQHGLIGPTHPAYANNRFWQGGSRLAPTSFLVWNASTREFLERTTGRTACIRDFDDFYYFPDIQHRGGDSRPCVLVSLQWGTVLPQPVIDMIIQLDCVRWIVRPHPRDPIQPAERPEIPKLSALAHVEINDQTQPLLPTLIRCDLHITENSSVVIEAAAIGRPSIFWDRSYAEAFESETRSGLAKVASPDEMLELVRQALWPSTLACTPVHD